MGLRDGQVGKRTQAAAEFLRRLVNEYSCEETSKHVAMTDVVMVLMEMSLSHGTLLGQLDSGDDRTREQLLTQVVSALKSEDRDRSSAALKYFQPILALLEVMWPFKWECFSHLVQPQRTSPAHVHVRFFGGGGGDRE